MNNIVPAAAPTQEEIALIRASFMELLKKFSADNGFALAIYEQLFTVAPQVQPMFTTNTSMQAEKLKAMFVRIVAHLDKPERLEELTASLGKSHAGYQIEAAHYDVLKGVIVDVFQTHAPEVFDTPTLTAWGKAYDLIAQKMLAQSGS